jgi:transposase InsO family protein
MPWQEIKPMEKRLEFALRAQGCDNFRALCREYGISPRVGYKWKHRLLEQGAWQLAEKSRRPQSSPHGLREEEVCRLVQLRQGHPTWGARKLQDIYRRVHGQAPSESTIKRVLERCGLVKKRRKRRASLGGQLGGQPVAAACNDIWTVDFKGWWHDAEGRCEPLTVRDEYSRYVLEVRALADARTETVRACFERLFELYGLPGAIRSDNGSPFAHYASPLGLSRLSAWWVALGINLLRGRPGRPGDNSHHERLHRDLGAEVEGLEYVGRQAALEVWRKEFNELRPHEALGMKRPAEVYTPSTRLWEGTPEQIDYEGLMTRRVQDCGTICFQRQSYYLSAALARWDVGLKPCDHESFEVYFAKLLIGHLDLGRASFRPMNAAASNQRHAA